MAISNDPRPVLRQELARVFKDQRMIRAFEKIFDLIPPEFIDQQVQIDAISLVADLANSQTADALAAIARLSSAVEQLALAPRSIDTHITDNLQPPAIIMPDVINLSSVPPLDQDIVPTWTGTHTYSGINLRVSFSGAGLSASYMLWANTGCGAAVGIGASVGGLFVGAPVYSMGVGTTTATDVSLASNNIERQRITSNGNIIMNQPVSGDTLTLAPSVTTGALIATNAALTNNAGAAAGTLANAPAAGNPTKWIKINDNGTIRSIPTW